MKKLYEFERIIEYFDAFSSVFNLKINRRRKFSTMISIVCSVIAYLLCSAYFLSLFIRFIKRENPNVTYMNLRAEKILNTTLNTKDAIYSLSLRDKDYYFLNDPTIVTVVPTYEKMVNIDGELVQTVDELEIVNCSIIYPFYEMYKLESTYNDLSMEYSFCFNSSEKNIILGGEYGTEFYGNLAIYIKKCINSTENNNHCRSQELIDSTVQGSWIQIDYINSYVDINNFSEPIQRSAANYYSLLDPNLNKVVYEYYFPINFYSQNGIIFDNSVVYNSIVVESKMSDINNVEKDRGVVYTIYICPSGNKDEYHRKYDKILEIFSSIGGTWYVFNFFFRILTSKYNNKKLNLFLANSLFSFTLTENKSQDKSIKTFFKKLNVKPEFNINEKNKNKKIRKNISIQKNNIKSLHFLGINSIRKDILSNCNISNSNYILNRTNDFGLVNDPFKCQLKKNYTNKPIEILRLNNIIGNSKTNGDFNKIKQQDNNKSINIENSQEEVNVYKRQKNQININNKVHLKDNGYNTLIFSDSDYNNASNNFYKLVANERYNNRNGKNINYFKIKYDYCYISRILFCRCLNTNENLNREYKLINNELSHYSDFIELIKLLMEIEAKQGELINIIIEKNK